MLLLPPHHVVRPPLVVSGLLLAFSWVGESQAVDTTSRQQRNFENTTENTAEQAPRPDYSRRGLTTGDQAYRHTVSTSLWTTHFNPQPEHNNTQRFIGIERHGDNFVTAPLQERFAVLKSADPVLGLAHFQNSYHQSTLFAYAGFSKAFWGHPVFTARVKVSAGFIHGYRNQFQYKVPLNNLGTSPAAIPSVTLHYQRVHTEMILFGTSGLMLNLGYSF